MLQPIGLQRVRHGLATEPHNNNEVEDSVTEHSQAYTISGCLGSLVESA